MAFWELAPGQGKIGAMFRNYLKIAFRNLAKYKIYSFINILSLAVGMALCVLILLFIRDELSFETFHESARRIYRIGQLEDHNNKLVPSVRIGPAVAKTLQRDFPEAVENSVRISVMTWHNKVWIKAI